MKGSHALSNAIRQHARAAMKDFSQAQIYLISSYDGNGSVKVNVTYDPLSPVIESNWMPLGCIGVGNGWGIAVGPEIGDQVLCVFENGDFNSGVVVARLFSTVAQPLPVPSGEIWAIHKTTTSLKFLNNGDLDITTAGNLNANVAGSVNATVAGNVNAAVTGNITASAAAATLTAPTTIVGNLQVNGNIQASGTIADLNNAHGTIGALRTAYDGHTHSGVATGTYSTSTPSVTV